VTSMFFCGACASQPPFREVDIVDASGDKRPFVDGRNRKVSQVFTSRDLAVAEGDKNLFFYGKVKDDLGDFLVGANVQFWQTDVMGVYDHSGDPQDIDPNFQYYGTATTDEKGSFVFKIHRPGIYGWRPTHIHYKVFYGDEKKVLLTSQFYFSDENLNYSELQTLKIKNTKDFDGKKSWKTTKSIVIDMGRGGNLPITPRDMEGPFYPEIDFMRYDNDLTVPIGCQEEAWASPRELITKKAATCEGISKEAPIASLPVKNIKKCEKLCKKKTDCLGFHFSKKPEKKCELYRSRPTLVKSKSKSVTCGRAKGLCTMS